MQELLEAIKQALSNDSKDRFDDVEIVIEPDEETDEILFTFDERSFSITVTDL